MKLAIAIAVVLVVGCGKSGSDKTDKTDKTDNTDPAKPSEPAAPTAKAGGDACEASAKHVFALMEASDKFKHLVTADAMAKEISTCRTEAWPAPLVDCFTKASNVDEILETCNKLAFTGELDLKPTREVPPGEDSQEGDFVVFNKAERCGSMLKKKFGAEAVFVLCKGKVIAGPLTTPAEIDAVFAELSKLSANAHELTMSVMKNWPTKCSNCKYRVYDENGVLIREE